MLPQVIDYRLHKDRPVLVVRLIRRHHNLRMVHRHRRRNHIDRRKRQIDSNQIFLIDRGARPMLATVQISHATPQAVIAHLVTPPRRRIQTTLDYLMLVSAGLASHQKCTLSGRRSMLRPCERASTSAFRPRCSRVRCCSSGGNWDR